MKLIRSGMLVAAFVLASAAQAVEVIDVPLANVLAKSPSNNQIYFGFELSPIENWDSRSREAMDLFGGYRAVETLNGLTQKEELEIYRSRAAFVLNRSASSIDLSSIDTLRFLQSFDTDLKHDQVSESMANTQYQMALDQRLEIKLKSIDNQVNRGVLSPADAERAKEVLNHQAMINANQSWCKAGSDCISSRAEFPGDWQLILDSGKAVGQIDPDFPKEIAFLSEVVRGTPAQLGQRSELKALSEEVPYPATYALVQSSFWFNRFLQSGKTVISLHELSGDQTLVVITTAFAIEADALTKYDMFNFRIRDVFLGDSFFINRDQGFAKGFPPYNKDLAARLKGQLEAL